MFPSIKIGPGKSIPVEEPFSLIHTHWVNTHMHTEIKSLLVCVCAFSELGLKWGGWSHRRTKQDKECEPRHYLNLCQSATPSPSTQEPPAHTQRCQSPDSTSNIRSTPAAQISVRCVFSNLFSPDCVSVWTGDTVTSWQTASISQAFCRSVLISCYQCIMYLMF